MPKYSFTLQAMMRILLSCVVGLFTTVSIVSAQSGGRQTYKFLNMVSSARVAALGGNLVSSNDNDLNLYTFNPALLNASMHDQLVLNYVNFFAGINYGFAAYSRSYQKYGNFAAGIQYINYGKFIRADENGNILGEFSVGEYNLHLGWSKQLDTLFSIGAAFKTIYSQLEDYTSIGIAFDIGTNYVSIDRNFTMGLVVRNFGTQLKAYRPGNREPLPLDIQFGLSKKLEHVPFRLLLTAHNLQKFDLSSPGSSEAAVDPLTGETLKEKKRIGDKIMRHFTFGGEFILSKSFNIRFGYNYLRRQELKVNSRVSTVGFSYGFGFRISKFHLSYGRAAYHLAGGSNHFTISTNVSDFYKKDAATSVK